MQKSQIILNDDLFIGEGMGRKCYIHPENNNLCIKIPSPRAKRSSKREKSYFKRLHWYGKSFEHIADFKGSIDTNNGSGDLYELVRDYDGSISKNLEFYFEINDKKITSKMLGLIEDLRVYLKEQYILFSDLDMDNILVQKIDKKSWKLVIIDGVGDNNQIPFLEFIKPLGIKRNIKKWNLFKAKIDEKFPNIAKNIKNFSDKT